jgi:beta-glucosidase
VVTGKLKFMFRQAAIQEAVGTQDFIGLNYYSVDDMFFSLKPGRMIIDRRFPKGAELSETGFIANLPEGMYRSMVWASRYRLPIYITENGVEDCQDTLRPKYIIEHLYQAWLAIQAGIPIKGYYYWSLTDNFEWERGWKQGFGLYGLDPLTQERIWRPSVDIFADICRTNAVSFELVEKYAPKLLNSPAMAPRRVQRANI